MPTASRARIEALLRARKLDRTLGVPDSTPAMPPASAGIHSLDNLLGGGLRRGQLSEIVGPRSSGRTSLLMAVLAAATTRGELAALVDTLDTFDPESAAAAGVDLSRLLWVRGLPIGGGRDGDGLWRSGRERAPLEMALRRAVKAMGLVLEAGGPGVVALDLADIPAAALRRLPFVTWGRLTRALEGRPAVGVLLSAVPVARSPGGVTMALSPSGIRWAGAGVRARLFRGFDVSCRIVRARSGPGVEEAVIRVGA